MSPAPYNTAVPQSGTNIFDTSAGAYNQGVAGAQAVMSPALMEMTMNEYLNPYTEQVVGSSLQRLREQQAMDLNQVRGQAAQSGAYGGARQGLVEAEVMDRYNRNAGELVGNLYNTAFNNAAQYGQSRMGQILDASRSLSTMADRGFGMGRQINSDMFSYGQKQQSLMQAILDQANQQVQGRINYPMQAAQIAGGSLSSNPLMNASTTTQQYNPGILDLLSMGAGIMGGGK